MSLSWRVLWAWMATWAVVGASSTFAQGAGDWPEATIRSYCQPESVVIGEPFTLTVDIVHSKRQRILVDRPHNGEDLELGDNWVLLEGRRVVRLPIDGGDDRQLTQIRWRLFGVEPGTFELPTVGADGVASGAVQRLEAMPASMVVRAELAEGEDAARPPLGFRPPPSPVADPLRNVLRVGLGLWIAGVLLLIAVAWIVRRRRPKVALGAKPTPLQRLASIDVHDDAHARDSFYVLSRAVREALDRTAGERLDGLTDEEWIERRQAQNGIARERLVDAAELLRSCERVKYGAEAPTRWAVEEAVTRARALCSESAAADSPSKPGGPA